MKASNEALARATIGVNVVVIRNKKLLLGKRKNTAGDGSWGLMGGRLEKGEKIFDCARRELDEEVGLRAKSFKFFNVMFQLQGRQKDHWIQVGLMAKGIKGKVKLKEPDRCYEWKWFELDKLPKRIFRSHKAHLDKLKGKDGVYTEEKYLL